MDNERLLKSARESICIQAESIKFLENQINSDFEDLCKKILKIKGKLILMGVGKSGHIGRKIASTFASTGTPAFYIHPAEASHGDLGMIDSSDLVLCISYSGETEEITFPSPQDTDPVELPLFFSKISFIDSSTILISFL